MSKFPDEDKILTSLSIKFSAPTLILIDQKWQIYSIFTCNLKKIDYLRKKRDHLLEEKLAKI